MGDTVPLQRTWRESKGIIYVVLIIVFVVLLAAVIVVVKLNTFSDDNICITKECVSTSFLLLDLIDTEASPCDNFYNFTCGNYKGLTLMLDLQSAIDRKFKHLITNPIEDEDSRSVRMQKQFYQTCTDLTAIEKDQNEPLKKLFQNVSEWPVLTGDKWNESSFDWGEIVVKCRDTGLHFDWFINLRNEENKLYISPPNNVNYVEDTLKDGYIELMTNVVKLLGAIGNITDIYPSMRNVANFEIELSKIINQSQVNATDTEYTIYDILDNKMPSIPWSSLLRYGELPLKIMFKDIGYIQKLGQLLNRTPKRVQADYIFWKLTESFSQFLTQDIRKHFEIYADLSKNYTYHENMENYCFGKTTTIFPWVAEAEYVRRYASERKPIQDIVDHIKLALHDRTDKATWMDRSDKERAFNKLQNLSVIIGGPDEMYDEHEFEKLLGNDQIDLSGLNNTIEMICKVAKSRDSFTLDYKNRKTLDVGRAKLYQQVTNLEFIKYQSNENIMFLPAAALNSLFFSQGRPNSLNYGALGSIIGHKLAHSIGIMETSAYKDGKEIMLWSNETTEHFFEAAECLLQQCTDIGVEGNITINCTSSFEDRFADYVGIIISYESYRNLQPKEEENSLPALPYTSNQLFWIIYSSMKCNNMHINDTENLTHMLEYQRIVSSLQNTEYFAKDFNCAAGSNMNPTERCKIL